MDAQPVHKKLKSLSLTQLKELRSKSTGADTSGRLTPLVAQRRKAALPLSYAQEGLWLLSQLEPESPVYNLSTAVRLEGHLDTTALARSLSELTRRHESLRTRFQSIDGLPGQIIDPARPVEFPIHDLSDVPTESRAQKANDLSTREARHPFDLARGPLLRVSLIKLSAKEHVLLVTIHHIVSDGWSLGILNSELGTLYRNHLQEGGSALAELPVQYADYAVWQRNWLQGVLFDKQLNYWKKQLEGLQSLQLPTDRPRPPVLNFKGATFDFQLCAERTASLTKLALARGATLYMVLLAAFKVLLSRYSGQEDIAVGSPVAGRTNSQVEALIGLFVNTLVLRTDLSGDPTFVQVLERVKDVTLAALANQDIPFERLVKDLQIGRGLGGGPVLRAVLAMQNYPQEPLEMAGLRWTSADTDTVTTHFDLTLHLQEDVGGIRGVFEYSTELFDPSTIERMASQFCVLAQESVRDPFCSVRQLRLLRTDQLAGMLREFSRADVNINEGRFIHEQIETQAQKRPDAIAIVCGSREVTYRELSRRSNRLARILREHDVRAEERVAVYTDRSVDMIVAFLGVMKAGGASVPLDPAQPPERLRYLLADIRPIVVLAQQELAQRVAIGLEKWIALEQEMLEPETELPLMSVPIRRDNLAYIIYTSGSTGAPKGVMVEHRNLIYFVGWCAVVFVFRVGCCCFCVVGVGF